MLKGRRPWVRITAHKRHSVIEYTVFKRWYQLLSNHPATAQATLLFSSYLTSSDKCNNFISDKDIQYKYIHYLILTKLPQTAGK